MANSRTTFTVADVESGADEDEIEAALQEREGVQLVDVERGEVTVRYGEELISEEEIESVVRELGYEVEKAEES